MNTEAQVADWCIREIDALMAAVRYCDAAAAALLQPPEVRRPDFDEWLAGQRAALTSFLDGRTATPLELTEFAAYVSWMLKSYRKDVRAFRLMVWVARKIMRLQLPLQPPVEAPAGGNDPRALGGASWIVLLAVVALWLATR